MKRASSGFCAVAATALASAIAGCSEGAGDRADDPSGGDAATFRAGPPLVISGAVPEVADGCALIASEGEVMLAVDPADGQRLVAVWVAGAFDGATLGVTAHSADGGRNWTRTAIPAAGPCTGGSGDYVLDQWVSIDAGGRAYYYSFSGDDGDTQHTPFSMHTLASASADGVTWLDAVMLDDNQQGLMGLISRTSVTADPATPGRAWALWSRILNPATDGVLVARTDDGGVTWQAAVTAAKVPGGVAAAWQLLVTPSGQLVLLYGEGDTESTGRELLRGFIGGQASIVNRAVRSDDGGATWSAPETIVVLPEFVVPRGAVGPDGRLYFVWNDRTDDVITVRFVMGSESAPDWSEPATVTSFAAGQLPSLDVEPDIAVAADGVIGVSFYRSAGGSDDRIARWFAYSSDDGGSWEALPLVEPFSYDTGTGGTSDGPLGAYQGLVATGDGFGAAFIVGTGKTENPTEVIYVRIARGAL